MSVSIFNHDNNLPGVVTEIDSHLSSEYDTSLFGTTDSVCVIGTAFDGPVGLAAPVYSVEHAIYVYGKPYDAKTRRESSLVAGIQEAWNKGCRTIYAMRINGVEMKKDFDFCSNKGFKLRVQSRYPSNLGKQCYLKYDNSTGMETFTLYKPASRATIGEKMNGLVESENSVMSIEIAIGLDYGYDKNTKLSDVISVINNHIYNNILELEIVDEDGNVVTNASEALEVTLGDVYPGVYFIGRGESACDKVTELKTNIVLDKEDTVPYSDFNKKYFNVLVKNTDVASSLPIYYTDLTDMRSILVKVGITMDKADDYLKVIEETNKAFPEDEVDYEESDLTAFEKYMKLGNGFATTAIAERRVDGEGNELLPRVKESPVTDAQHIVPTGDGIYSILEDAKIRYHVLAHDICANTIIKGKTPKPEAFKKTVAESVSLMNGLITAVRKVDENDSHTPQSYNWMIYDYKNVPIITKDNLFKDMVIEIIGYAEKEEDIVNAKDVKVGEKCLLISEDGCKLYIANNDGVYEETNDKKYAGENGLVYFAGWKPILCTYVDNALSFSVMTTTDEISAITGGKEYVMMKEGTALFITNMADYTQEPPFAATAEVALDTENDEDLFVYYQDHSTGNNHIMISYPYFDTTTVSDFVDLLNKSDLNKYFEFALTQEGQILKDEYVTDADASAAAENNGTSVLTAGFIQWQKADRIRGYDYSKHIPYTTSDNFARHLAQHCTYTELKTYPTHGIIGLERVNDVSKTNLAKLISDLKAFNWNMYAKNNAGRNMLDQNNLPYSIGRNVSITGFQEACVVNNYTAILNGATAYAGLISALEVARSSTACQIDVSPHYEFSRTQLQTLSALGIVTVRNSFTMGYVITDGITMAPNDDQLRRLYNTRVMHYVEDLIRAASEPFIGTTNNSANRNSLQTAIKSNLNQLLDVLLRKYDFNIVDDGTADQFTYIEIHYSIVTMNEIREIRNYIKVQNR